MAPKSILQAIEGSVPDPYQRPPGCPFSNRCPSFVPGTCDAVLPPLYRVGKTQAVRCFLHEGSDIVTSAASEAGSGDS